MAFLEELLDPFVITKKERGNPFPPVCSGGWGFHVEAHCGNGPLPTDPTFSITSGIHPPENFSWCGVPRFLVSATRVGAGFPTARSACRTPSLVGMRAQVSTQPTYLVITQEGRDRRGVDLVHSSPFSGAVVGYMRGGALFLLPQQRHLRFLPLRELGLLALLPFVVRWGTGVVRGLVRDPATSGVASMAIPFTAITRNGTDRTSLSGSLQVSS